MKQDDTLGLALFVVILMLSAALITFIGLNLVFDAHKNEHQTLVRVRVA